MDKHIIYITDMNMGGADSAATAVPRSGYANIGIELCKRLSENNQVKVLGLGYTGQEHRNNFSIVPCSSLQDVAGYINNLKFLWNVDVVIVALDIHHFQEQLFPAVQKLEIPYICITPLESDPLCPSWASLLTQMDKVFFISQFGADEADKAGVDADHIEIGIDTDAWRLRTEEEYKRVRQAMGFDDDDFVVITVADNQERKNISGGLQALAKLKDNGVSIKHILVTRENSMVGWKLYDLAFMDDINLSSELRVFQSGMEFKDLYALYCSADAYLSCSKGEGLGLPIMEAMSVGVPVVANTTGALPEHLADGRGWLTKYKFWHYDPFGNQRRYFIDIDHAAENLMEVRRLQKAGNIKYIEVLARARQYMESKDWRKSTQQIESAIESLTNET